MIHRWTYCTSCRLIVSLSVLTLASVAGCWQEVEYAEPPSPNDARAPQAQQEGGDTVQPAEDSAGARSDETTVDTGGEQFADELAESLATDSSDQADLLASAPTLEMSPTAEPTTQDDFLFAPAGDPADSESDPAGSREPPPHVEPPTSETPSPTSDEPGGLFNTDPLLEEPTVFEPEFPTESTTATAPSRKVRHAAWLLGSKLSLAALAHGRGAAGDEVQQWMDEARTLGRSFGVAVPDLPARPLATSDQSSVPATALEYLFAAGQQIGDSLAKQHGPEAAALFEMAVKSNMLLVLYKPGGAAVDAIADSISQAASRAKLPAELWQPLANLLSEQASPADVRADVYRMHSDVDAYLSGAEGDTP